MPIFYHNLTDEVICKSYAWHILLFADVGMTQFSVKWLWKRSNAHRYEKRVIHWILPPDVHHQVWRTQRAFWRQTLARRTQTTEETRVTQFRHSSSKNACKSYFIMNVSRRFLISISSSVMPQILCTLPSLHHEGLSMATCSGAPCLLSLLKHPEEGGHGTDVKGVCGDGHDVVQDASHLSVQNYKYNTELIQPFTAEMGLMTRKM